MAFARFMGVVLGWATIALITFGAYWAGCCLVGVTFDWRVAVIGAVIATAIKGVIAMAKMCIDEDY